jgi:hypothetical protein
LPELYNIGLAIHHVDSNYRYHQIAPGLKHVFDDKDVAPEFFLNLGYAVKSCINLIEIYLPCKDICSVFAALS